LSLIASFSSLSQGQTVANPPSIDFVNDASTPSDCLGIRPAHLWSFDYAKLLWSDTGAVLTATNAFQFKPFSNNQSFPSGHSSQAFAVATAIAENYPVWWVQTLCYGGAGGLRSDRTKRPLRERRRGRSASRVGGRPCSRASPQWLPAQFRKTELESLRRRRQCSPRIFQVVLIDAFPA
jgi:hypothetical protein